MTAANHIMIDWLTGAVAGILTDKILSKPETQQLLFDYVEHYHIAMAAYGVSRITGSPRAHGMATTMLIIEGMKDDPFGRNQPAAVQRKNFTLATILLGGLLLTV